MGAAWWVTGDLVDVKWLIALHRLENSIRIELIPQVYVRDDNVNYSDFQL